LTGMEAGQTASPQVAAERLYAAVEMALSRGLTSFAPFLDAYSRFVWRFPDNADDLFIPNRVWRKFRGGSTMRDGRGMFIPYRNVLLASGILEELRPADEESRLCGSWKSHLPVPEGPDAADETWRIVAARLSERPSDPFCVDAVRRHMSRCVPYMPGGGGKHAGLELSKRNRFRVDQLRIALAISANDTGPDHDHTIVSTWPGDDIDGIDSADLAIFSPGGRKPTALIKCGLGNADDDSADAFLSLIAGTELCRKARLVFLSVYDPDPKLRAKCEAAGVEVMSVLLRRAPEDIPAAAEARAAEEAFDRSNS